MHFQAGGIVGTVADSIAVPSQINKTLAICLKHIVHILKFVSQLLAERYRRRSIRFQYHGAYHANRTCHEDHCVLSRSVVLSARRALLYDEVMRGPRNFLLRRKLNTQQNRK